MFIPTLRVLCNFDDYYLAIRCVREGRQWFQSKKPVNSRGRELDGFDKSLQNVRSTTLKRVWSSRPHAPRRIPRFVAHSWNPAELWRAINLGRAEASPRCLGMQLETPLLTRCTAISENYPPYRPRARLLPRTSYEISIANVPLKIAQTTLYLFVSFFLSFLFLTASRVYFVQRFGTKSNGLRSVFVKTGYFLKRFGYVSPFTCLH